jgi:hypothetical protein
LRSRTTLLALTGLALTCLVVSGCTWVKLTDGGAAVDQAALEQVGDCLLVGNVSTTTQDRVLLERGRGKVAEELIVLARNEAATLGGDTIVPAGAMSNGHQDFNVYRCNGG